MLKTGDKIRSSNLEIEFLYKTEEDKLIKRKTYTVVCRCGNRKLMLAKDCVRCHECGAGHDYETFLKKKEECYQLALSGDGRTGRIKQWEEPNNSSVVPRFNPRTGELTFVDKKTIPKIKTRYFYCSACKRSLPWTNEDKLAGIPPPIVDFKDGERCFDCIREITKTIFR